MDSTNGDALKQEGIDFSQIYKKYYPRLIKIARRIVRNDDDAKDVVQDAFLSFYKYLPKYDKNRAQAYTLLYRIVINESNDCMRLRKRGTLDMCGEMTDPLDVEAPTSYSPDHGLFDRMAIRRIQPSIDDLPEKYRAPFLMKVVDQWTYDMISDALQIPIGTVKSHVSKAKSLLIRKISNT